MAGRRPTSVRVLVLLLVLALAAAGCGDDDEPVAAGAGPGGVTLAAEYVSVEVTAGGEPRPLVPGTEIRLTFDGDHLGASLGCNQLGGTFTVEGTRLVVEALETTEMGCDPALHDQDRWFAELLAGRPQILTSGGEIQVDDGHTRIVLRDVEVAEPDRPLLATTWEVTGFVDGGGPEGTTMSIAVDRPGTLQLLDTGFVVGFDGCNDLGYGGSADEPPSEGLRWDLDGDQLTFAGDPVSTAIGCEGPQAEHADRYRAVLAGTVTWTVDADRLTITAADGRGVTYRAVGG